MTMKDWNEAEKELDIEKKKYLDLCELTERQRKKVSGMEMNLQKQFHFETIDE